MKQNVIGNPAAVALHGFAQLTDTGLMLQHGAKPMLDVAERPGRTFLTANQVKLRYGGISDMTLTRWCRDPALKFPQPVKINRRKFFALDELEECDRRRAEATHKAK